MEAEFAAEFVKEWEAAWNSRDLDRVLSHYSEDVVFQSPYVMQRLGEPSGEVRGKEALRAYWASGLQAQPTLHFTLDDMRLSVDTLVINYRNERGHQITEVLSFCGGLVSWGCGAYLPGPSLSATHVTS